MIVREEEPAEFGDTLTFGLIVRIPVGVLLFRGAPAVKVEAPLVESFAVLDGAVGDFHFDGPAPVVDAAGGEPDPVPAVIAVSGVVEQAAVGAAAACVDRELVGRAAVAKGVEHQGDDIAAEIVMFAGVALDVSRLILAEDETVEISIVGEEFGNRAVQGRPGVVGLELEEIAG